MRALLGFLLLLGALTAEAKPLCLDDMVARGLLPHPFLAKLISERRTISTPAVNTYLVEGPDGIEARPEFRDLVHLLLSRTPQAQARINALLNENLAVTGNSFFKKGPGGIGGAYFVPEVHGMVMPMSQAYWSSLVESTGPVMRELRKILQGFLSSSRPTIRDMGLEDYEPAERRELVRLMRESIYFEPQIRHAALAGYPFLFTGGFDAAIDNWTESMNLFYEFNLGTPSGAANNLQVLEGIRLHDPALYDLLRDRLPRDETWTILRRVLEANALAWTRNRRGISVVISPGVWNAAHPDVVYQSLFTGLPLVRPSDLYQDADGNIRLNTGRRAADPVVTGIYSRMEEAYLLNDPDAGIPTRGPYVAKINARLGRQMGLELDPNILYDYTYGSDNQPNGITLDERGRPQFQRIWDRIGKDPARSRARAGSFLDAIHRRRLYVTNLGGRLVDNKHIFTIVARQLARTAPEGSRYAQPPYTLSPGEYEEFYRATDLSQYVVKAPHLSGKEGVYILANHPPHEQREIVAMVKRQPGLYLVQRFVNGVVLLTPQRSRGGRRPAWHYGTRLSDLRVFVFQGPDGEIEAGPNSALLRVAGEGSGASNTSAGGGYGALAVMTPRPVRLRNADVSLLPEATRRNLLPALRVPAVRVFLQSLKDLIGRSRPGLTLALDAKAAEAEAMKCREVMDLVGYGVIPFMHDVREYAAKRLSQGGLRARLQAYRNLLLAGESYTDQGMGPLIAEIFGNRVESGASALTGTGQ